MANSSGDAAQAVGGTAFPWLPGSATGVGSLPGTDPREAMRLVFGELPDLPHLAELPARGPGADLTGRTAALLVDLPVETVPGGWRFASRPGRELIRARGMLSSDLDALEEAASGYEGPLKVQVCGPWTLTATIQLGQSQDVALADLGAAADVAASLAEGVRAHVDEIRRRVPGARVLLQLDEPALPAVLTGQVPTASGLNRLSAIPGPEAEAVLRSLVSAAQAFTIIHCCAVSVPFGIMRNAGAGAVSFDLSLLRGGEDELAETAEAGLGILAGVVPASPGPKAAGRVPPARDVAGEVVEIWRRMGWPSARSGPGAAGPESLPGQVVLTPACGLAGASPVYARAALARCREAARILPELIEESR